MSKPSIDLGEWTPDPSKVIEPSVGKKAEGFNPDEKPPAQYFNWYWKGLLEWAKFWYDVAIDTATSITSFDINKGANVTNSGTNTTTINCSETTVSGDSNVIKNSTIININTQSVNVSDSENITLTNKVSDGSIENSEDIDVSTSTDVDFDLRKFEIKNSENVDFLSDAKSVVGLSVKNSANITVGAGNFIKVENSSLCSVIDDKSTVINSTSCDASNGSKIIDSNNSSSIASGSTIHGVDDFDEVRENTDTFNSVRVVGSKILRKIFDSYSVYGIGNTDQKVFGNRYLSAQSTQYWHREVGDWRQSNILLANLAIIGGQQSTDGLFATSVELVDSTDTIEYPLSPSYDEGQNHTLSFWLKAIVDDTGSANTVVADFAYDATAATYGWRISYSVTGFVFSAKQSSGAYSTWLSNIPLKQGEFQHILVTFSVVDSSYSLYIDSKFIGTIYVDSIIGDAGQVKLKFGANSDGNSPAIVNVSDVSFWTDSIKSPQEIQKLYSGGIEMSVASPSLFADSEISVIQKHGGDIIETPLYLGFTDDLFVNIKFPDWMKNSENITETTVDVYTEKYVLEDF